MKQKKVSGLLSALGKSPINYFSDLFIITMVVAWIVTIVVMMVMAVWATVAISDTSIWAYVDNLVTVPLSAGGALWMIKNGVNHAIAGTKGKTAEKDFPAVPVEDLDDRELCGESE